MNDSAAKVIHAFLDAVEGLDFDAATDYLDSNHFSYRGPLSSYQSAAEFMAEFARIEPILKRIDRRHSLSNGSEAALFLDILTHVPDLASSHIALWASVKDGRIVAMEFYYDARAYTAMFECS